MYTSYHKRNSILLILLGCLFCLSCAKNKVVYPQCQPIAVDRSLFFSSQGDDFDFEEVNIEGDCLEITIRYGGGCGSIIASLIDSGDIRDSQPLMRNLRLVLADRDPCEASVTKKFSYDLTRIREPDQNIIRLDLLGWPIPIYYDY